MPDFPTPGSHALLGWQEGSQGFGILNLATGCAEGSLGGMRVRFPGLPRESGDLQLDELEGEAIPGDSGISFEGEVTNNGATEMEISVRRVVNGQVKPGEGIDAEVGASNTASIDFEIDCDEGETVTLFIEGGNGVICLTFPCPTWA